MASADKADCKNEILKRLLFDDVMSLIDGQGSITRYTVESVLTDIAEDIESYIGSLQASTVQLQLITSAIGTWTLQQRADYLKNLENIAMESDFYQFRYHIDTFLRLACAKVYSQVKVNDRLQSKVTMIGESAFSRLMVTFSTSPLRIKLYDAYVALIREYGNNGNHVEPLATGGAGNLHWQMVLPGMATADVIWRPIRRFCTDRQESLVAMEKGMQSKHDFGLLLAGIHAQVENAIRIQLLPGSIKDKKGSVQSLVDALRGNASDVPEELTRRVNNKHYQNPFGVTDDLRRTRYSARELLAELNRLRNLVLHENYMISEATFKACCRLLYGADSLGQVEVLARGENGPRLAGLFWDIIPQPE